MSFPPKEATQMSHEVKYIGMDVHKEAIVIAVLDEGGKQVMESIIETKASSILEFVHGLRGELHVTWEEGTWAAWLYDLLQPQMQHIVVCNPRRNALLKEGSKSDKVDAHKLADLLRTGMLRPVYHGENGLRTLRELGRSYETISKDLTRVMNRLKALYRGWGIPCAGTQFAFQKIQRDGRAIEFYKSAPATLTGVVNGMCDEFFSRAGFPLDEDSRVCGGNLLHLVESRFEGSAIADDPLERTLGLI
jgi:transposase